MFPVMNHCLRLASFFLALFPLTWSITSLSTISQGLGFRNPPYELEIAISKAAVGCRSTCCPLGAFFTAVQCSLATWFVMWTNNLAAASDEGSGSSLNISISFLGLRANPSCWLSNLCSFFFSRASATGWQGVWTKTEGSPWVATKQHGIWASHQWDTSWYFQLTMDIWRDLW